MSEFKIFWLASQKDHWNFHLRPPREEGQYILGFFRAFSKAHSTFHDPVPSYPKPRTHDRNVLGY